MAELSPVKIQLVANGIENVKQAFQSIEQSAKKLEDALNRTRRTGATKRKDETKREEEAISKIKNAEAKKREAAQEREFAKLARQAEKWRREEIAAEKRKNAQLEAEAKKSANARSRFFSNMGSKIAGGVSRGIGMATTLAGGIAAIGGGFGIAESVGQSLANQKLSRQISLQTFNRNTGKYDLSQEQVYGMGKNLAAETGFTTKESIEAVKAFGETGGYENIDKMKGAIKDIGNLAIATGADFSQLSKSAGLIFAGDPSQKAEELIKKLRMMAVMGRAGAVDLDDMAGSLNRITASAAQFSGDKMKNLTTMAALTQLARTRGTASSAEEATEATKSLSLDIAHNAKHFQALGINVKDPKTGELTDPRTVVMRSLAATHGDSEKLLKLYGHRSFKGIQGVQRIFQEERGKALKEGLSEQKASQRGLDAANKALDEFTETVVDAARLNKEADEMKKDPSIRLQQEFDKLKNAVGDRLVPELTKVIPKIAELTPQIVRLIDKLVALGLWLAENPLKGAFIAVAALIAKEAALALTADFFKKLFMGGGGGGAGGGGDPRAAAVAAAAAGGILAGISITDNTSSITKRDKQDLINLKKRADDVWNDPKATKEEKEKALNDLNKKISEQQSFGGRLVNNVSRVFDPKNAEAGDLWNLIPLFAAYNAALGGKDFGGAGGTAEELKKVQDAFIEANKVNAKNNDVVDKNTQAMLNLTTAINKKEPTPPPAPGPPGPDTSGNGPFGGGAGGKRGGGPPVGW